MKYCAFLGYVPFFKIKKLECRGEKQNFPWRGRIQRYGREYQKRKQLLILFNFLFSNRKTDI